MEDDDEFGDLYTDVLENFPNSSSSQGQQSTPQKPSGLLPLPPPSLPVRRTIDLNLELNEDDEDVVDEGYRGAAEARQAENLGGATESGTLEQVRPPGLELDLNNSGRQLGFENGKEQENENLASGKSGETNGREVAEGGGGGNFDEESFRFDLEEEAQAQDGNGDLGMGSELVIPGLSTVPGSGGGGSYGEAGGDDWDSDDSEDDLQIVLNDTSHGPMGREMGGGIGGGDLDDGQDDGMRIGAEDGAGSQHPGMEEQEWGEDGEKKEGGEVAMVNPGMIVAPKPGGYGGHGYQQFHSQFKYVRPGAAPLQGPPAPGPVGMPGQIRPPVYMGPMAGRGRGEWRPQGMKSTPGMPKGYGGPGWGNNAAGRGFGIGLDFTLPSHKTIFEVDIDSFEEKPWNNPGVDITDFFNFGLAEDSWKQYCKQLEQFRVESTMQSKIRVYVSGRSEQEYDPDMPPELVAAAGVVETAPENLSFRKNDVNQTDTRKDFTPARPQLPVGRPIQVETGSGERLPSIDTRPQRIRDSDAIVEIVCDGFAEGESSEDDAPQPSENDDPSKTEQIEDQAKEEAPVETNNVDHSPGKGMLHHQFDPSDSRGHTPVHSSGTEDRRKSKLRDESPNSLSLDTSVDDHKDGSSEGINEKTRTSVSPGKAKDERQSSVDRIENDDPDLVVAEETLEMEENVQDDTRTEAKNQDEVLPDSKRQNTGPRDSAPSGHDNGESLKGARTNDSSKVRSGNGRENQKTREIGEQVSQGGSMRNTKRHLVEDERNAQRRSRDERHNMERHQDAVKGKEDPYVHRDVGLARPSYGKLDSFDKRKERDSSEGDPHSRKARTDDYRKQDPMPLERGDEMGSKNSSKAWDGDRIDKEDHSYLNKQMDNGNWRGHHDKDVGSRQRERDEILKARHENIDDYRRRKNEEILRRDYPEKEDTLLGRRDSPSLRKRERDDLVDQRRRDDQSRIRESTKDHNLVRQKDEVWIQRERSDRLSERVDRERPKQYHEGSMTKREREEIREPIRSGRSTDDKRAGHAKERDENNDVARFAEPKRRDRVDDVNRIHYSGHEDRQTRGNRSSNHDSKYRKDRPSSHIDHNTSSNQKTNDGKTKESLTNKESDSRSQNSLNISRRAKDEHNSHKVEKAGSKHSSGQGNSAHRTQAHPNSARKRGEEAVTDDDEQQQSKKGRSKLERWTSHKDRDFAATSKSSSSSKAKETIRSSISTESSVPVESVDKPTNLAEAHDPKQSTEEKAPQDTDNKKEEENKKNDLVQASDQHLDTVAKLKKRSERFKLPMPSEKDTTKQKPEAEAPPPQTETPPTEPEVKSERPPRKRRWISST